ALIAKNILSFVDGSQLCPKSDDLLYEACVRCNSMFISWITSYFCLHQAFSSVKFPNNLDIPVMQIGSVHLSHELTLYNVLFVSHFKFNLLFIISLTK
ncbi:hypothetical protein F511_36931, partial [Dorcoceras hygrometricum]